MGDLDPQRRGSNQKVNQPGPTAEKLGASAKVDDVRRGLVLFHAMHIHVHFVLIIVALCDIVSQFHF